MYSLVFLGGYSSLGQMTELHSGLQISLRPDGALLYTIKEGCCVDVMLAGPDAQDQTGKEAVCPLLPSPSCPWACCS